MDLKTVKAHINEDDHTRLFYGSPILFVAGYARSVDQDGDRLTFSMAPSIRYEFGTSNDIIEATRWDLELSLSELAHLKHERGSDPLTPRGKSHHNYIVFLTSNGILAYDEKLKHYIKRAEYLTNSQLTRGRKKSKIIHPDELIVQLPVDESPVF